jgi:hypothetical protein
MRRAAAAFIVFTMLVAPALLAQAKNGEDRSGTPDGTAPSTSGEGTLVSLLVPLVNIPATVVSLEFIKEANGKVKHNSPSDESPMKYPDGKSRSLGVHLRFNASGLDVDAEFAALTAFAKASQGSNAPIMITLVWGGLGAFVVTLDSLSPNAVNITYDHVYQHYQTDFEFIVSQADPAKDPPRAFSFQQPALDLPIWVLNFAIEPKPPWETHRNSEPDEPTLNFTSGEAKTLSVELMFDTYEEGISVKPFVTSLLNFSFASTSPNATAPVDFTWGPNGPFRAFITTADARYTMFLPDGTPARATVGLNMSGAHPTPRHGSTTQNLPYAPNIFFGSPALALDATLIALDAWRNTTDDKGAESIDTQLHANADTAPFEFKSAKPMNLSVELFFDGYESKTDVSGIVGALSSFAKGDPNDKRPPICLFTWGDAMPVFGGVISSLDVRYTMFLPDGTPVRAVADLSFKNASPAEDEQPQMHVAHVHLEMAPLALTESTRPGQPGIVDITLKGPFTGARGALVDWVLAMGQAGESTLNVSLRFRAPNVADGNWTCTQVSYVPPQFTLNGSSVDRIIFTAEALGPNLLVATQFDQGSSWNRCPIFETKTNTSSPHSGHARERTDEFVKATGFRVDISGNNSTADTFQGGEVVVPLTLDDSAPMHYRPGNQKPGTITLTRKASQLGSDWADWFKSSNATQGADQRNLTVSFTNATGAVLFSLEYRARIASYLLQDSDKGGLSIERIEIAFDKVERA